MGGGEGKGRFRKAVAKTTLLRQMSSKVLPLTNPEARLSSEDLRRKKQGSMRAQIKQRATGRVQVSDLYFSMLDMSWGTMLSYCVLAYVCTVALWACVTLAAANDIDGSALSLSAKPFVKSLAFACENIVTMGWGQMEPRSGTAFALGVLQHLTGLALNVLVFAIVCTKFQHPQSQLVFGDRACIVKRRGVPYLLIRLGNKRCNLIYHPDAKLSLLTPVSTPEGESYVRNESLEVKMPGVITCVEIGFRVPHAIDAFHTGYYGHIFDSAPHRRTQPPETGTRRLGEEFSAEEHNSHLRRPRRRFPRRLTLHQALLVERRRGAGP